MVGQWLLIYLLEFQVGLKFESLFTRGVIAGIIVSDYYANNFPIFANYGF